MRAWSGLSAAALRAGKGARAAFLVKYVEKQESGWPRALHTCMVQVAPEVDERGAETGRYVYIVSCMRRVEGAADRHRRRYSLVGIVHSDFKDCDAELWVRKYGLARGLARLLQAACLDIVASYPPAEGW